MHLKLTRCSLRSWEELDAESLARYANNRKIWANLRDGFPHPYRLEHAEAFIEMARRQRPESLLAIAVGDEAVGGIGCHLRADVERFGAEMGYFLAEPCWGRGIVTEVVRAFVPYALETFGLVRIFAEPYAHNRASCRVLEKAGFQHEGTLRRNSFKDGRFVDQELYAFVLDP
jgi:RimJ/RimL family protein N-acetyltransferase